MQRLPSKEDPRRPHIVSHVDEEKRKIATSPEQTREYHKSAHLAEQRRNRCRPLRDETGDDLTNEQEQQDDRHQLEQLRQITQPDVRLEIGESDRHRRVTLGVGG